MKNKLGAVAIVLVISVSAMAQQGNGPRNGQGNKGNGQYQQFERGNRMAAMLDLSEEQQTKHDALRTEHQKKMIPLRNQLNVKKAELQVLSAEYPANAKAINVKIDEIAALKAQMMKERENHRQEMRKMLSDNQRVLFDMHHQKRGGKGKGMGNGHGRGHGNGAGQGAGNCYYR